MAAFLVFRLLRVRAFARLARVLPVRHVHDPPGDQEHRDPPDDQPHEPRLLVARQWCGHFAPRCRKENRRRPQATRTFVIVSSFVIFFITSSPCVILPNTVCTPLRCRVLSSLSTMKNWLPPVSFPACAIDSAPTSCLRGLPAVSHLIFQPGPPVPMRGSPAGRSRDRGSPPCTTK